MKHAFGGYSICNRWKEIGITILITNDWFRKTVSRSNSSSDSQSQLSIFTPTKSFIKAVMIWKILEWYKKDSSLFDSIVGISSLIPSVFKDNYNSFFLLLKFDYTNNLDSHSQEVMDFEVCSFLVWYLTFTKTISSLILAPNQKNSLLR